MTTVYSLLPYRPDREICETIRGEVTRTVERSKQSPSPESPSFKLEGVNWIVMGPLHPSSSDLEEHWTVQGVLDSGEVISIIHVYPGGREAVLFRNGGRWQKDKRLLHVKERGILL